MMIIFQNLISNAIKYQKPRIDDAYLHISVDISTQQAHICLSDNGIGIEPAYASKIFEMFFRASAGSYGSGLGLYITKQVVEKLKGQIHVASTLGEGTQFTVILPNLYSQFL
jgi:signal transduction histidine kinase